MQNKKQYSREEKIKYYQDRIEFAKKKLAYLQSDEYQDWKSNLQKQIEAAVIKQLKGAL